MMNEAEIDRLLPKIRLAIKQEPGRASLKKAVATGDPEQLLSVIFGLIADLLTAEGYKVYAELPGVVRYLGSHPELPLVAEIATDLTGR